MKKSKFEARLPLSLAGALLLGLLSACASTTPTAENRLAERAQARWDALLSKDYAAAYAYYSPGYRAKASVTDLEIKLRMQRVIWTAAKVVDTDCAGDVCTVNIDLNYQVASPVPGVDVWDGFDKGKEQWVKVDGKWWYVLPKD